MKMIRSEIELPVGPTQPFDIVALLRPLVSFLRYVKGNAGCCLWERIGDTRSICFITQWCSRDDLDRHFVSKEFRMVLAAMDLCAAKPSVSFCQVDEIDGMEYIATLRNRDTTKQGGVQFDESK